MANFLLGTHRAVRGDGVFLPVSIIAKSSKSGGLNPSASETYAPRRCSVERVRWTRGQWLLALGLVLASVLVTFRGWVETLHLVLSDEEVQYVLIAPIFIFWLVWVRRARLAYCRLRHRWIGPVMMGCGWAAWITGYCYSVPTAMHCGPIMLAVGALVSVVGTDVLRKFAPAVLALAFLIPITPTRRQIIAAPMERYAAQWTQETCQLLGMDVKREGNLLSIHGTQVEVAEACNGMRQLIAFWMISYTLAFSQPLRWYMRVLILLLVPVLAIVSNVMRLVPTVWAYSFGANETAHRVHDAMGWLMLALAFAIIYGTLWALRWAMVPIQHFQRASA